MTNSDLLEKAKGQAMKYLAVRMRSRKEIQIYLRKKGYGQDIIEQVMLFLDNYQYLDDEKFCEAWINDRILLKPCGRRKIIFELREKGVDREIIDQAMADYFPYETELALACHLAEKKSAQDIDPAKIKNYLNYRGFSYDLIIRALEKNQE